MGRTSLPCSPVDFEDGDRICDHLGERVRVSDMKPEQFSSHYTYRTLDRAPTVLMGCPGGCCYGAFANERFAANNSVLGPVSRSSSVMLIVVSTVCDAQEIFSGYDPVYRAFGDHSAELQARAAAHLSNFTGDPSALILSLTSATVSLVY